jgi:hypothetical protein
VMIDDRELGRAVARHQLDVDSRNGPIEPGRRERVARGG